MKVVKYTYKGPFCIPVARCGMKNTQRHKKWEKDCLEQFERIGLPNKPIDKIHKMKIEFHFPTYSVTYGNNEAGSAVADLMIKAGIIKDVNFCSIKHTQYEAKFKRLKAGFTVWLYVDERDGRNKGIAFSLLPVISKVI